MRLLVGQSGFRADVQRYAARFDVMEVLAAKGRHPRLPRLREWRTRAPEALAVVVALPPLITALEPSEEATHALEHAGRVAEALGAGWWSVCTPVTVSPAPRWRRRLAELAARLRELRPGSRVAWEPRGPWDPEDAAALARELDLHLVRDLGREPAVPGSRVVFTRLRALADGGRVGASAIERVSERLEGAEEALVIIDGDGAAQAALSLRGLLGAGGEDVNGPHRVALDDDAGADDDEPDDDEPDDDADDDDDDADDDDDDADDDADDDDDDDDEGPR